MRRPVLWLLLLSMGIVLWVAALVALVAATLSPQQQRLLVDALSPRWPLLAMMIATGVAAMFVAVRWFHRRYVRAALQLRDHVVMAQAAQVPHTIPSMAAPEIGALAQAIQGLSTQRDLLRYTMAAQIQEAAQHIQREKSRLSALIAELNQSVLVCDMEGRILLYNNRARIQLKALSPTPEFAGGAEIVGIGRPIYAVFDRQWVAHALDSLAHRVARGATNPSAQFVVSTLSGQLLRVQIAPVWDPETLTRGPHGGMGGFVMLLDNVTRSFEEEARHDQWLLDLSHEVRSSLSSVNVALDQMLADRDGGVARDHSALTQVRDRIIALRAHVDTQARQSAAARKSRWLLEEMQAADLLLAAQRWIQNHWGRPVALETADESLWLKIDSYSLLQALAHLAGRLMDEFDVRFVLLRVQAGPDSALLDLVWDGAVMSTETAMSWELSPMQVGERVSKLSVRDVVERHGGDMWFERQRSSYQAFFRFSLPMVDKPETMQWLAPADLGSRPEYFDLDFFKASRSDAGLDDQPLNELTYTVFDTETTGLRPAEGDEIIQIGATRIVRGTLLRNECFDQLVDPGRIIPKATIPIHGISQEMVMGKPRIGQVMQAFHSFAADTVLVAHNAAFDMKFLELKAKETGVAFTQPILDTMLLSSVVHPDQESHRLEALAERFQIPVEGRHTALGDALLTAQVWLRLLPLLQAMGIQTLGQAREAAQRTYYAKIKY